jgi:hypothetical protein
VRNGQRSGCDPHHRTPELERLTRPCLEERIHALVEELAPVRPVLGEHGELLGPVPQTEDDRRQAAAAAEIEHCDVLGHAQRVVQWQQQRVERHLHRLRAGEHHPSTAPARCPRRPISNDRATTAPLQFGRQALCGKRGAATIRKTELWPTGSVDVGPSADC